MAENKIFVRAGETGVGCRVCRVEVWCIQKFFCRLAKGMDRVVYDRRGDKLRGIPRLRASHGSKDGGREFNWRGKNQQPVKILFCVSLKWPVLSVFFSSWKTG